MVRWAVNRKLARGILLQGRSDERRRRAPLALLPLDPVNLQFAARRLAQTVTHPVRMLSIGDIELLQPIIFEADQPWT